MICLADYKDKQQVMSLWKYCFEDSPEFMDFYFETCYNPNNTLIVREQGKICSSLQLLPYKLKLRGRVVNACYIVGVSTWPEFRNRGCIADLLRFAGDIMAQREMPVSILLPFQYSFYRKYGWEICYEMINYRQLTFSEQKHAPDSNSTFEQIDADRDIEIIDRCYKRFMHNFNGYIIRDENNWTKIIRDIQLDNGTGYTYRRSGEVAGYILYTKQDKHLNIKELIYLTPEAKASLLKLALSHIGQVDYVSWRAPATDQTFLRMSDSRGHLEKETFVMGRINNIQEALSGLAADDLMIPVKISDPLFESNNRCFMLTGKNGLLDVKPTDCEPAAVIGIQTLNRLLWGCTTAEAAWHEGLISCSDSCVVSQLGKLFPPAPTYISEEF